MDKHVAIKKWVKVQRNLMTIKTLSASGEIDRLCTEAIAEVVELGQGLYPELVKMQEVDVMQ